MQLPSSPNATASRSKRDFDFSTEFVIHGFLYYPNRVTLGELTDSVMSSPRNRILYRATKTDYSPAFHGLHYETILAGRFDYEAGERRYARHRELVSASDEEDGTVEEINDEQDGTEEDQSSVDDQDESEGDDADTENEGDVEDDEEEDHSDMDTSDDEVDM
jgi:hypothetical protein